MNNIQNQQKIASNIVTIRRSMTHDSCIKEKIEKHETAEGSAE